MSGGLAASVFGPLAVPESSSQNLKRKVVLTRRVIDVIALH